LPLPLGWEQMERFSGQNGVAARAGVTIRDAASD
jgi:hypothetical protein